MSALGPDPDDARDALIDDASIPADYSAGDFDDDHRLNEQFITDDELLGVLAEYGISDISHRGPNDPSWIAHNMTVIRAMTRRRDALAKARQEHIDEAMLQAEGMCRAESLRLEKEIAGRLALLEEWAANERAKNPENVSTVTPIGTISTTRTTDVVVWDDDALLLAQLVDNPGMVRVKTTTVLDKTAIKKASMVKDNRLILDGEILQGVTVIPERITAKVVLS